MSKRPQKRMRILFIGAYQGPEVISRRRIVRNRSLAGTTKMHAIAEALMSLGHEVVFYSSGRPAERTWRAFPPMTEDVEVPAGGSFRVQYGAAVDQLGVGNLVSILEMLNRVPRMCARYRFHAAIVYNLQTDSVLGALYCRWLSNIPVILEYEDAATAVRHGKPPWWKRIFHLSEWAMSRTAGGIYAPSPELAERLGIENRLVMPGAIGDDIVAAAENRTEHLQPGQKLRLLYAGGLSPSKGVDILMDAVERVDHALEVHICGRGPMADEISRRCRESRHDATFHGQVPRETLVKLLASADICVNPHRTKWHSEGTLWPFKVVEYLAACGVVVSARTGRIEPEMERRLTIFEDDDPELLARAIRDVIDNWAAHRKEAPQRMRWATERWGAEGVGRALETLILRAQDGMKRRGEKGSPCG